MQRPCGRPAIQSCIGKCSDRLTCLCVKWIVNQVKFTGKLLVVFSLQVQRVFIGAESVVWGKTLLKSLVRKRRWRYIQDSVRCRRARDCSPAQSLLRSTRPPQSGKARKFKGSWDSINRWIEDNTWKGPRALVKASWGAQSLTWDDKCVYEKNWMKSVWWQAWDEKLKIWTSFKSPRNQPRPLFELHLAKSCRWGPWSWAFHHTWQWNQCQENQSHVKIDVKVYQ